MEGIDLIVGTQHKMDLPRYVTSLERRPQPEVLHTRTIARDDFTLEGIGEFEETRANLKVQDGCNFMCSFCIIPFSRGHERSRHLGDLVREAKALVARGHREIVITGVNVGRYNHNGHSFMDAIRSLEQVPGLARIRISSIEPTTIPDELLERMAGGSKVCPYLHVPLQSGDDAILKAMNRRYSTRDYAAFIDRAIKQVPKVGLGTDVMVGFPGETDEAFERTRSFLVDLPFAYFHVFSYSPRPGTGSLKLPGKVSANTVKSRSHALSSLSRGKRLDFYLRHVGQTVSVLFESRNKHGLFTGLTANYVRVGVSGEEDLTNQIRPVEIHGVMDGLALGALVDL
jgi:threonylcarbamoyladenosine tRNA methylthiotransferase MtaB